jgi:hypothetical protein
MCYIVFVQWRTDMQKFDILSDGPFRYVHSTETGELLTTLSKERNGNMRETGKFVEYEGEDAPVAHTLRQWKAILSRRFARRFDVAA